MISGFNHEITIKPNLDIDKIMISGDNNKIKLPQGSSYEILDSGFNSQIIYY